MSQYNWEEIKAKYETGKYSMKELAQEYGFNASYGRRKANKQGWEKGKSNKEVTERATKKIIEEEADKEAKLRQEYEKIINNIRRGAYNTLMKEKDFNRLKQFKIASEIMRNLRREQWEVNQIQEVAEKVESEIYGKDGGDIEVSYEKTEEALEQFRETLGNLRAEN